MPGRSNAKGSGVKGAEPNSRAPCGGNRIQWPRTSHRLLVPLCSALPAQSGTTASADFPDRAGISLDKGMALRCTRTGCTGLPLELRALTGEAVSPKKPCLISGFCSLRRISCSGLPSDQALRLSLCPFIAVSAPSTAEDLHLHCHTHARRTSPASLLSDLSFRERFGVC
jgi:hypothetical protein